MCFKICSENSQIVLFIFPIHQNMLQKYGNLLFSFQNHLLHCNTKCFLRLSNKNDLRRSLYSNLYAENERSASIDVIGESLNKVSSAGESCLIYSLSLFVPLYNFKTAIHFLPNSFRSSKFILDKIFCNFNYLVQNFCLQFSYRMDNNFEIIFDVDQLGFNLRRT